MLNEIRLTTRTMFRPSSASSVAAPSAINLRRLVVLRCIALGGQVLAVAGAIHWLKVELPLRPLFVVLSGIAIVNALTWVRVHRPWPVHDFELFAHFTLDVLALTGLLYFSGGSTNPFAPLYLLPLTLTAAALPWAYTWTMAALTVACYSSLLFVYVPLAPAHAGHEDFHLHVLGMWLGFLLSAGLIAYFAVQMADTRRERDRLRAEMRERDLRHAQVLALGTLAAGAAHELGTPLSSIAVLAKELEKAAGGAPDRWQLLRAQVVRCKEILSSLSATTGGIRAEGGCAEALDAYLTQLIRRWQTERPGAALQCALDGTRPAPHIFADQTLSQAIVNMLNNAADVSPAHIEIDARWTDEALTMEIRDRGPGFSEAVRERAGAPFFTTKEPGQGMGLGLFLARGTLERLGGGVVLSNRRDGGATCRIELPLTALRVSES